MNFLKKLFRIFKNLPQRLKVKFSVVKTKLKYKLNFARVGILIESLDKGGLEQVVYNISTNWGGIKPYIFIKGKELGLNGLKLRDKGYEVFTLDDNLEKFLKIVKEKNVEIINSHYSVWALQDLYKIGIKIIYTIHSNYTWIYKDEDIKYRKIYYEVVDKFIAVSSNTKSYFSQKFNIPKEKIDVVTNGLNLKEFHTGVKKRSFSKERDKFIFLNVGAFNPVKNHLLMISAFNELLKSKKEIHLWFVGNNFSDEYYNKVKKTIKDLGLENNIKILDFVNRDELSNIYKKAHCFLLPSLQEGCSNVLFEAMAFGLPVIASDVGAAMDILKNYGIIIPNGYTNLLNENTETLYGENGIALSLEQGNKRELIESMEEIYSNYDIWCKRAKLSSTFIRKNYNIANTVKGYKRIFRHVLLKRIDIV